MNKPHCIIIHPSDNVGILIHGGNEGMAVKLPQPPGMEIVLKNQVPSGHKIALRNIPAGSAIVKSGQTIGLSLNDITEGEHVHVHNIKLIEESLFSGDIIKTYTSVENDTSGLPASFMGFVRPDGRTGIRNYVLIVSSSNCAASVVKKIGSYFSFQDFSAKGIDGVVPVTYGGGCALSKEGSTYDVFSKTLLGWLDHPNVVGAVIVGLGCEIITEKGLEEKYRQRRESLTGNIPITSFTIQDSGGSKQAITRGIAEVNSLIENLPVFQRTMVPLSSLILGLNCGGSDSLSAVTANPTLGMAGDYLVKNGGSIVLAEYPECHGAEKHLINRCLHPEDKKVMQEIVCWWKDYAARNKVTFDDNLSEGNKEGGISTILEKSMGAIAKGGTSPISQVVRYSEKITGSGLVFMDTPGYDPVSVTGLIAGGCQMVAFTTGRGSVYGCSIAPVIKITTNTELFKHMGDDMDINAGKMIEGVNISEVSREIYNFVVEVAGGIKTKSELNGIGWEEFVPWQVGETL